MSPCRTNMLQVVGSKPFKTNMHQPYIEHERYRSDNFNCQRNQVPSTKCLYPEEKTEGI